MAGTPAAIPARQNICPAPENISSRAARSEISATFAPPEQDAIKIDGFRDDNRTFGGCKCYKINIKGIRCAIVRPDRTSYSPMLVEIIAPVNLRKSLGITDGDEVEVVLE